MTLPSNVRRSQWVGHLTPYDLQILWKAGKVHTNADALSCIITMEDLKQSLLGLDKENIKAATAYDLEIDPNLYKELVDHH